jgi:hypothetical protein
MRSGPVLIGYDGSAAAEHAIREGGALLGSTTRDIIRHATCPVVIVRDYERSRG